MIRLRDLIPEEFVKYKSARTSTVNSEVAYKRLLETKFSEAYNLSKTTGCNLYRHLRKFSGKFAYVNPTRVERKSRDTNNFYTILLSYLPSWKNYPKRSYSVIALYSTRDAEDSHESLADYGAFQYYVYPQNGAKICVTSKPDAFYAFPNLYQRFGRYISDFSDSFIYSMRFYCNKFENSEVHNQLLTQFENLSYNNIGKIIELLNNIDVDDLINNLHGNTSFSSGLREDLKTYFKGDWLNYFDELFSPEKNEIRLVNLTELYNIKSHDVEVWTDSPCLLVSTGITSSV